MNEQESRDNKIIIENRTKLPVETILIYIGHVIRRGKVSNYGKQYAYLTTYQLPDDLILHISATINNKSHRFIAW